MYSDFDESKDLGLYRELAFSYHAVKKAKEEYDRACERHNLARLNYIQSGKLIPDQFMFTN